MTGLMADLATLLAVTIAHFTGLSITSDAKKSYASDLN